MHCCLATGGPGAAHETCTLWPPPAPFGYFPVWESTSSARRRTKPPTRNRFLVGGKGKMLPCFFCFVEGFASAEATRGLSGRPLDPFGGPPLEANGKAYKNWILCGRQGKDVFLAFPVLWRVSPLRRRPGGFPVAPWTPSGTPLEANGKAYKNWISCGRQGKDVFLLFLFRGGFRLCGGDQGAFRSPPWTPSGTTS